MCNSATNVEQTARAHAAEILHSLFHLKSLNEKKTKKRTYNSDIFFDILE